MGEDHLWAPLIPNDGNDFQIEFDVIDPVLWRRTGAVILR
jgi:hypothetical protein